MTYPATPEQTALLRLYEILSQHAPFLAAEDERRQLAEKWAEVQPLATECVKRIRSVVDETDATITRMEETP